MNTAESIRTEQYLTFTLDEEAFAVPVTSVREVLDVAPVTRIPHAPPFLRGVIDVRGRAVPVADLSVKFGGPPTETTRDTRIVVMELKAEGKVALFGAFADAVHDVVELETGDIEPPPRIGARWQADFIEGIGRRDNRFVLILNMGSVFSEEELTVVRAAGGRTKAGDA